MGYLPAALLALLALWLLESLLFLFLYRRSRGSLRRAPVRQRG